MMSDVRCEPRQTATLRGLRAHQAVNKVRVASALALAAMILWIDLGPAPDSASSVLYVMPILLVRPGTRRMLIAWSGLFCGLTILGLFGAHGWSPGPASIQRASVGIVAIIAATILALRSHQAAEMPTINAALERTRAELERALRDATIGAASASIAHEVNQPLAAMTTYADAARRWMDRDPPDLAEARQALQQAANAARHASDVVRRLRSLYGKAATENAPVLIDPMVAETARLVRSDLADNQVALALDLRAPDAVVMGDRILLQQALINLLTNGIQAIAATHDRERRLNVFTAFAAGELMIRVEDSGDGFAPEAASRACDAFFTTKPNGMGLGLAICQAAAQAHDGRIEIGRRADGSGASVRLILPIAA